VNAKLAKWFREWAGAVAVGLTFTGLVTGATWILGERISNVETRLGERISDVETRVSVIETKLDLLLAANGLKTAGEPRPASAGTG